MFLFPADRPTNQIPRSHLTVDRSVVAELERAETSRLSSSSSSCVHPACFLRRAAQLSFLQLQTRQVKGQSPLQRAQVVQQPERNALWTGEQWRQRIQNHPEHVWLRRDAPFDSPAAVWVWDDAGRSETGRLLWSRRDQSVCLLNFHPDPAAAGCPRKNSCGFIEEVKAVKTAVFLMFYTSKMDKKWLVVMIWSRGHQRQKQEVKREGKVSHLSFDLHKLFLAHTTATCFPSATHTFL